MNTEARSSEVVIRHCQGLSEFQACLEVQQRVWGAPDLDVPLPLFVVAPETGGQVLGAFAGTKLVGFTLALAGIHGSKTFLHSHMTAVLEEHRDRGIGRRLKLFQRQDALSRGIELVEWTFDPLEVKNAYFNLVRLGAVVRRFLHNYYGVTSSPLHAGLPTDRLVAEWWLRSARVEEILSGAGSHPTRKKKPSQRIHVPAEIGEIKQKDPARAARLQAEAAEQFERWFARGYAATGMEITPAGGDYLLELWSDS